MVLFKVNGERNTGTNFLHEIMTKNEFPLYKDGAKGRETTYWKHGVPKDIYKQLDERVIDIFVFRELNGWLSSMYKNPYELIPKFDDMESFLSVKHTAVRESNGDDTGKTIFQIRYHKFNSIMTYRDRNEDIVFVNLNYLQNKDKMLNFLKTLDKRYMSRDRTDYITHIPHTKTKDQGTVNRDYGIDMEKYRDIIESQTEHTTEKFINNLDFEVK